MGFNFDNKYAYNPQMNHFDSQYSSYPAWQRNTSFTPSQTNHYTPQHQTSTFPTQPSYPSSHTEKAVQEINEI